MKTFTLAALVALTIVFVGCASTGDMVGTSAHMQWPSGSDSQFE